MLVCGKGDRDISEQRSDTYISIEFGEGVDHIKPVHINYSSVDN